MADLPPLPPPDHSLDCGMQPFFREDQLLAFAREAVKQERERAAKEAEHWQEISRPEHKCGEYIAAAIRARSSMESKNG